MEEWGKNGEKGVENPLKRVSRMENRDEKA